ncbi:MAG: protein-disulfide reductase DsbD family protein [Luteolibacter sp.]
MRVILSSFAALGLLSCVLRAEEATKGVDLSLISEVPAVTASKPFTVALKVHHHLKFHTYWQNSGIVGVPIALKWKLPEGFTAGPIQWATPEKVDMAGHPAHGYERDVLLLVEITPPAQLPSKIELKAEASWMACADGCYPGQKELALDFPAADQSAAIAKARAELPQPLRGWNAALESAKDGPEIRVKFTRSGDNKVDPGKLYFFSSDGQISSDPPQKIEALPDGFRLIAERSEYSPKGCATLPGVLVAEKPLAPEAGKAAVVETAYP